MEPNQAEWRSVENAPEGPSVDFIRAIADLLETDADDILTELGYSHPDEAELAAVEA